MADAAVPAPKKGFFKDLPRYAVLAIGYAGWFYLTSGKGRLEFAVPLGPWAIAGLVAAIVIGIAALFSNLPERLSWPGVVRVRIEGGYGWSDSIASHAVGILVFLSLFCALALVWSGFFAMAVQAWLQVDWGRLAVTAVFLAVPLWIVPRMLWPMFIVRPILVVDADGLHRWEGELPWGDIEKIVVGRGSLARAVFVYRNTGLGPAERLSLGPIGITVEEFLGRIEELAPQVVIERPQLPSRVFQ